MRYAIGLAVIFLCLSHVSAAELLKAVRLRAKAAHEAGMAYSDLKSTWRTQREILESSIVLREAELKRLDSAIASEKAAMQPLEQQLHQQLIANRDVRDSLADLERELRQLEKELRTLLKAFPPPLADEVEKALDRTPENTSLTTLGFRLYRVILALRRIDAFNRKTTVRSEIRTVADEKQIEVQVVYLGMTQAYFTDLAGRHAGVGMAKEGRWSWSVRPELGAKIRTLIERRQNGDGNDLISLPVGRD